MKYDKILVTRQYVWVIRKYGILEKKIGRDLIDH